MNLLEAIAKQEGFGAVGSRAQRNNNPGNINMGDFARNHGATRGDDKGYAVFPSPEVGFAALKALLQTSHYKGKTLSEALETYCPAKGDQRGDNDTPAYIANVSRWTGIEPDAVIDGHLG